METYEYECICVIYPFFDERIVSGWSFEYFYY